VKRAVDAVYGATRPDYLVLLGAPDVVPLQPLRNPFAAADDDPDPVVTSDLPYACNAAFGRGIERFVGPTRVLGRLPDEAGASDPALLLQLLDVAAGWRSRPAAAYDTCFALTADAWTRSTRRSVATIVRDGGVIHRAPPAGPRWTRAQLAHRLLFVNCHGAPADPMFYGEGRTGEQTDAIVSPELEGCVRPGAVAAAECCYGADLYDPAAFGVEPGICSRFLQEGGYGFFGSTTVAYGPEAGNEYADLITQYFLQEVRAGASLGRAALQAQQRFVIESAPLDPADLKTIAQFCLLGDPSIHPARVARSGRRSAAKADTTGMRRRRLAHRGARLEQSAARVETRASRETSHAIEDALIDAALHHHVEPRQVLSYTIRPGRAPSAVGARLLTPDQVRASGRYHVVFARPGRLRPSILNAVLLVAREERGKLGKVRVAVQKQQRRTATA
jgi:hypothetical protein